MMYWFVFFQIHGILKISCRKVMFSVVCVYPLGPTCNTHRKPQPGRIGSSSPRKEQQGRKGYPPPTTWKGHLSCFPPTDQRHHEIGPLSTHPQNQKHNKIGTHPTITTTIHLRVGIWARVVGLELKGFLHISTLTFVFRIQSRMVNEFLSFLFFAKRGQRIFQC